LLPVGYEATAEAYRRAASQVTAADLSNHYTSGLQYFNDQFVPGLKRTLARLSGGIWNLDEYCAYAAGSDVDLMSHIIEAVPGPVAVYPGDWFGFQVGASQPDRVRFTPDSHGTLACMCVPSVRNGHLTAQMLQFLTDAEHCLLNINLYPTLAPEERHQIAQVLAPLLPKSILSISFSRGFALTASQLGVILVHRDHPLRRKFETQWSWFTYFFNLIAARAFELLDLSQIQQVDEKRRIWVTNWLKQRNLPVVESGSYYVKSFQVTGQIPPKLSPLIRGGLLRLCMKPPIT
jgi:hypothetical protein